MCKQQEGEAPHQQGHEVLTFLGGQSVFLLSLCLLQLALVELGDFLYVGFVRHVEDAELERVLQDLSVTHTHARTRARTHTHTHTHRANRHFRHVED